MRNEEYIECIIILLKKLDNNKLKKVYEFIHHKFVNS